MNLKLKKILTLIIILLYIIGISTTIYLYFIGFNFKLYFQGLIGINIYYKIFIVFCFYLFRTYLFIPSTFVIIFAGYFLQNFSIALIVSIIGLLFGIIQSYFIGYLAGENIKKVETKINKSHYKDKIKNNGYKVIFIGSLFPIVPVDILYFSSGFIKYNFIKTVLAGFFGELPLLVLYVYLGDKANIYGKEFLLIGLIILVIYFIYFLIKKLFFKK